MSKQADSQDLQLINSLCQQNKISPCWSSQQAFELARSILVRLRESAQGINDIDRLAQIESTLACVLAGRGATSSVEISAMRARYYVHRGAKLPTNTTDDICSMYIAKKDYAAAEKFCLNQLRAPSPNDPRDIADSEHALNNLTRLYALQDYLLLCCDTYRKLLALFENNKEKLFEYSERFAEILVRFEVREAPTVVEQTKALGLELGKLTPATVDAWFASLMEKRGTKVFK